MKKFLPKTINNPSGFTLIELMVVISIMAILSVVGFTLFTNAQKGARDAERKSEIDAIAKAYELTYNANTAVYVVPIGSSFAAGTVPSDPVGTNTAYAHNTVNSAKGFWACATLEMTTGNASAPGGASTTTTYPTYVTTNTGALYCKSSEQGR